MIFYVNARVVVHLDWTVIKQLPEKNGDTVLKYLLLMRMLTLNVLSFMLVPRLNSVECVYTMNQSSQSVAN